ncbi:hypothetical protein FRACYDRAFT_256000 [Fragilariopsis cylindrus CCMP1102]|uniref:Uncharacterized protein n=1 Tax=Fragilariopsis cylindrus CCMP1102 TaxID=635003 RepID=A0A1E7EJW7_9STRA|nr:hypothetical protein FRACYDRAFT_256000 [Fragilariopsis cylindrus CCMP1102]|eukprot:OEU06172.1 hypothetical protein FRACYDRAFT_256000 [Fragilariopsis cylindrus CCMP1102]
MASTTKETEVKEKVETETEPTGKSIGEIIEVKENRSANVTEKAVREIQLVLPSTEIEWIRNRNQAYGVQFKDRVNNRPRNERWQKAANDPHRFDYNASTGFTKYQEDKDGPWLDFMIAANVAPMKVKDFCVSQMHALYDTYTKLPEKFPEMLMDRTTYPRTKLIIGIRHPVSWFISFMNMGGVGDLYSRMEICPHLADPITGLPGGVATENSRTNKDREVCIGECRCNIPVCFHRARLHLPIARLGKTALTSVERDLIAPDDPDGGVNLFNGRIRNPIFVYDLTQMKQDSYWDEVAKFLGLSYIPNENYHSSKGAKHNKTLCTEYYDEFRSKMMAHSYNMSIWLEEYLLPVAVDGERPDVTIANPDEFRSIMESYKYDPCNRLIRRKSDGEYILDPSIGNGNHDDQF